MEETEVVMEGTEYSISQGLGRPEVELGTVVGRGRGDGFHECWRGNKGNEAGGRWRGYLIRRRKLYRTCT